MRFLALSLNDSQFLAAVLWKESKIYELSLNLVHSDDRTVSAPNLVQIGPRHFENTHVGVPTKKTLISRQ